MSTLHIQQLNQQQLNNKIGVASQEVTPFFHLYSQLNIEIFEKNLYKALCWRYNIGDYLKSAYTFNEMFKISDRILNYISSPICWGSLPYDYLSICYYELGDYQKALTAVNSAIKLNPEQRLIDNKNLFVNLLNNSLNKK